MKKFLLLLFIVSLSVGALFAETDIVNGVIPLPEVGTPETKNFDVIAEVASDELGLLLKYGDSDSTAAVITDDIESNTGTAWDVSDENGETNNFYFFGTGRESNTATYAVTITPAEFLRENTGDSSGVTPQVKYLSDSLEYAALSLSLTINATNPVAGTYIDNSAFQIVWNGTSLLAAAPAGTYASIVTVDIATE